MDDSGEVTLDSNGAYEIMGKCLTNEVVRPNLQVQTAPFIHFMCAKGLTFCDMIQVVNKILQHFPDRQLLDELSFVNKMWNYEARNVLRKRGNLIAIFKTDRVEDPCMKIKDFQLDLQRMNIVPFDGISVQLLYDCYPTPCSSCSTPSWEFNFEGTQLVRPFKHFSLELGGLWWYHKDCPVLLFIERVFHHLSPNIEALSLSVRDRGAFIPEIVKHVSFPRLKIFKQCYSLNIDNASAPYVKLVKTLVSRAPDLQELHCDGDMNLIGQLLEGSSAVLVYRDTLKAPFEQISDNVIGALRLQQVELKYTGPQFNFERFSRIAPILLQVCCTTTLRSMTVDAVLAVPLMTYGICFQNVNCLEMIISHDQLEITQPRILRILKDFDFAHVFPSLDYVRVTPSQPQLELEPGHMNRIIEEANVLREPVPDRAINIKRLSLQATLSHASIQFYAEMFPSILILEIEDYSEAIPFGSIWNYWRDLRGLRVEGNIAGNLDSVFCGIFPEEVAQLEQMDDEYLGKVNIVPVMPAVTCLTNLIFLYLKLHSLQDPTLLFSKVTRLVAFKRMRRFSLHFS